MRQACIDALYTSICNELFITQEQYEETLVGWDLTPLILDGKNIGVVMLRDKEIHVCLDPKQALLHARRIIKMCLDENIKRHTYLTTISFKEPETVRFLERLGFNKTGEDDTFISYRIDQSKLTKEKLCRL